MCKGALAIVLLMIVAYVDAEKNEASQVGSTSTAGSEAATEDHGISKAGSGDTTENQGTSTATTASAETKEAQTPKVEEDIPITKVENKALQEDSTDEPAEAQAPKVEEDIPITKVENEALQEDSTDDQSESEAEKGEEDIPLTKEEIEALQEDSTGLHGDRWTVSTQCLDCLCRLGGGCHGTIIESGCGGGSCGPFGMIYEFWEDAFDHKKPDGPTYKKDAVMESNWRTCANDLLCATTTMEHYLNKYPIDCNEDGKVDCIDYMAIHTMGPFGCQVKNNLKDWNRSYRGEMLQCLVKHEEGIYTKKMRELEEELKVQDIGGRKLAEMENKISTVEDKTAAEKAKGETTAETDPHKLTQEDAPMMTAV